MLLVMTLVGVSAVNTTSLEQRMARNARDGNLAYHAAEVALTDGEASITATAAIPDFAVGDYYSNGTGGRWAASQFVDAQVWQTDGIWDGATSVASANVVPGVASQPRYVVEHLVSILRSDNEFDTGNTYGATASVTDEVQIYRVTARGTGGTDSARVLIQSTFGLITQ